MRYSCLALILAASQAFLQPVRAGDARPVMFVRVPDKPCWQDMEFWNGVMEDLTLGQSFRRALNSKILTVLDTGQATEGGDRYQLNIATF
jgi:hypothetical protein